MNCPCLSGQAFQACCEPFLLGNARPETAEQLMRSRYTAYVQGNVPYLKNSLSKKSQEDFDEKSSREWAEKAEWQGLKILSTTHGGPADRQGIVEFVATYKHQGEAIEHHEVARFRRNDYEHWKYEDGDVTTHKDGEPVEEHPEPPRAETVVRTSPKVGRNEPCPCGSGKKFKKCCA